MPLYSLWEQSCLDRNNYDNDKCNQLMDKMMGVATEGINLYAVDYPECLEPDSNNNIPQSQKEEDSDEGEQRQAQEGAATNTVASTSTSTFVGKNGAVATTSKNSCQQKKRRMSSSQSKQLLNVTSITSPPFLPKEDMYHPCAETHFTIYLNRDDVKEALHVVDTGRYWSVCANNIDYSQEDSDKAQIYLYEELINMGKTSGIDLKMMVFSGDDDSICSTASTQYWIWGLTEPIADKVWQSWQYEDQTAGYITQFDLGKDTNSSFIFVTVHGAGHEVPAYRPAEALAMFSSYLNGKWDVKP